MMSELLNKLKDVDYKLWNEYQQWQQHDNIYDVTALEFILQGCLQRACERREWGFIICNQVANVCTKTSTYASEIYDTPAEALLAVYITAVREEAK